MVGIYSFMICTICMLYAYVSSIVFYSSSYKSSCHNHNQAVVPLFVYLLVGVYLCVYGAVCG